MSDDPNVAHTDRRGFLSHTAASLTLAGAGVRTGGADAGVTATSKPPHRARRRSQIRREAKSFASSLSITQSKGGRFTVSVYKAISTQTIRSTDRRLSACWLKSDQWTWRLR
jgi:hypothetical protein